MASQDEIGDLLSTGVLGAKKQIIYTCPKSFIAVITNIMYFNSSNAGVVCKSYFKKMTLSQFHQVTVAANSRSIIQDTSARIYLNSEDNLQGEAATPDVINYFVWGYERENFGFV